MGGIQAYTAEEVVREAISHACHVTTISGEVQEILGRSSVHISEVPCSADYSPLLSGCKQAVSIKMDGLESSSPTGKEQDGELETVSEETLKAALHLGGRRILDKIQPDFIETMRSAPNVKGGTADIIHRAMEQHKVRH